MRRRTLLETPMMGGAIDDPSLAPPMAVVFANKNDESLVIVEGDKWSTSAYPPEVFEPIGIVVIPGEHGVLKDGTGTVNQCGVMSIVSMSCNTPETGASSEDTIYWGGFTTDISGKSDSLGRYDSVTNGLLNYQHCVKTYFFTTNEADGYSSGSYSYIPRQGSVGGTPTRNKTPYAPSPYIGDDYMSGGYNESYGLKDGVVVEETNNALSDFKGIVNTKILTDLATAQRDWKTASSITNSYNDGYYPAACCCARYHTLGTKAFKDCTTEELRNGDGFWYLPAAGELGYIIPRLYDINDIISKLNDDYGVGVTLNTNRNFWSSSEYSSLSVYDVSTLEGSVFDSYKYNNFLRVRAFLRL